MASSGAAPPIAATVAIPFACGMLAGGVATPEGWTAVAMGGTVAFLASLSWMARPWARSWSGTTAAVAAGVGCGALAAALAAWPPPADDVARHVVRGVAAMDGVIVASERSGARVALVLRAERLGTRRRHGPVAGLVGVTIAHARQDWRPGQRVHVVGRLRRPRNFGNPGEYDFVAALARRGIRVRMFLWDESGIATVGAPDDAVGSALDRLRARVETLLAAHSREPVRGYLAAVLLGATQSVDTRTRAALARTGLAHVVSVSGFHVAVVAGACFLLLRTLAVRWSRLALVVDVGKLAGGLGLAPVAAYALIAGGSIPAARTFVMYGVMLAALACDRPPDGVRALASAAVVLAAATPDVARDASFELSFAAVLALFVVTAGRARRGDVPPTARHAGDRTAVLAVWGRRLVLQPLVVTIAATVATAPLTARHFQQVSLIAPLANLVALPLLGPATLLPGLAALPLVVAWPAVAEWLLTLASVAADAGLRLALWLSQFPWAAVSTPLPSWLEVGLCYGALALWWWRPPSAPSTRFRHAALVLVVVFGVADGAYWSWQRFGVATLRVTFLAVGQGDAAVIELPRGQVMVIDGGGFSGDFDPGERLIAPFLRSRKILTIDVLALSHPQLDHYGGLAYLAEHFAPREFWSNGMRAGAAGFVRLEAALDAAGTRRVVLARGWRRRRGDGVELAALHPERIDPAAVNDASLVLRVAHGASAVLFTGDIEQPAERELLRAPAALASTVLKVPHHGSATSSTAAWLRAVAPSVAIVSSGADNRFGFPSPAVVRRLTDVGAAVWNTADAGAITVVLDGADVTVMPTRPALRR